jgi:hypothetical protein
MLSSTILQRPRPELAVDAFVLRRALRGVAVARFGGVVVLAGVVAFSQGCATGAASRAKGGAAVQTKKKPAAPAKVTAKAEQGPPPGTAKDWEAFRRSDAALRAEIGRRAEAMRKGPVGSQATELASLRLAASGRDLIEAGSLDGAVEVLEKAISLNGHDGYAYMFLAYVQHVKGKGDRAAEFVASARRYLPKDAGVQAELEGLAYSVRSSMARAKGGA